MVSTATVVPLLALIRALIRFAVHLMLNIIGTLHVLMRDTSGLRLRVIRILRRLTVVIGVTNDIIFGRAIALSPRHIAASR